MEPAVTKCPECHQFLNASSPFCPCCGAFRDNPRGRHRLGFWIGLLVVALGALGWGLSRYGVLSVPSFWGTPATLAEQGERGTSFLQAFGAQDLGSLGVSRTEDTGVLPRVGEGERSVLAEHGESPSEAMGIAGMRMPEEIRRWLEHLKRVDLRREGANTQLGGEMTGLVVSLMPGVFVDPEEAESNDQKRRSTAQAVFRRVDDLFSDIQKDFHSLPPPRVCQPIAEEYSSALENTRTMILDLIEAVASLDMGKAMSLQNQSYARIDARVATCNAMIEALCERYQEPNRYRLFVDKPSSTAVPSAQILDNYRKLLESLLKGGE